MFIGFERFLTKIQTSASGALRDSLGNIWELVLNTTYLFLNPDTYIFASSPTKFQKKNRKSCFK